MLKKIWLLLIFCSFHSLAAQANDTLLVGWHFRNLHAVADTGLPINLSQTIKTNAEGSVDFLSGSMGSGDKCIAVSGWNNYETEQYWQISFSSKGYKDIRISARQKSSGTGPKKFKLQYSLSEKGIFQDIKELTMKDNFSILLNMEILPSQIVNKDSVFLRWVRVGDSSVNNGKIAGGGSNSLDEIMIYGTPKTASCETPENIETANIKQTSATLKWKGSANAYQIEYWQPSNMQITTICTNTEALNINNLSENTSYAWKVKGICDVSDSSIFSDISSFTTKAANAPHIQINKETINVNGTLGDSNISVKFTAHPKFLTSTQNVVIGIAGESKHLFNITPKEIPYQTNDSIEINVTFNTNAAISNVYAGKLFFAHPDINEQDSLPITVSLQTPTAFLLAEHVGYPTGEPLTENGWYAHSASGNNAVRTVEGSLTYRQEDPFVAGQKILLNTSGEDINKKFHHSINQGAIYLASLVSIDSVKTGGDFFMHLMSGNSSMYYRLSAKKNDNGLSFGLAIDNNTPTDYISTKYQLNTTYLLVLKCELKNNEPTVSLYINPDFKDLEPITANLTLSGQNQINLIDGLGLRQGSASSAPKVFVDNLRVATTWTEALKYMNLPESSKTNTSYNTLRELKKQAQNTNLCTYTGEAIISMTGIDSVSQKTYYAMQDQTAGIILLQDANNELFNIRLQEGDKLSNINGRFLQDKGIWLFSPQNNPDVINHNNTIEAEQHTISGLSNPDSIDALSFRLIHLSQLAFKSQGVFEFDKEYTARHNHENIRLYMPFNNVDYIGKNIPEQANISGIVFPDEDGIKFIPKVVMALDGPTFNQTAFGMKPYTIFVSGQTISIQTINSPDEITVFNTLGKTIYHGREYQFTVPENGIFVIKIRLGNQTFVEKIGIYL